MQCVCDAECADQIRLKGAVGNAQAGPTPSGQNAALLVEAE